MPGTPPDLFSESVNKTNVASKKKITSINGMISMRAFFLPPLLPPPDDPAIVEKGCPIYETRNGLLNAQTDSVRDGAFGLLEQDLKRVRHVRHVLLRLLGAGVQVIVREQADDGDRETARRGNE